MKINLSDLQRIEEEHNVITIQSDYPEIAYAVDKPNGVIWLINRQTGAQLEVSAENVYAFADELMSVAEVHMGQTGLHKVS